MTNETPKIARPLGWVRLNNALRDCDLETARKLLRDEQRGRKRREFLKRIQHRVAKLEKLADMAKVLGD